MVFYSLVSLFFNFYPLQRLGNENIDSPSMSSSLSTTNIPPTFDPHDILLNPKAIPSNIISKAKQILLSKSPIITRTCWNRRFGGDAALCSSAVQVLVVAGLLLQGDFAANGTKVYDGWLKQLPDDPTNTIITLNFQQTKLNIFNVTWQEYCASFKQIEYGHNKTSALISSTAADVLRSKPYRDIGFVLDESTVFVKNNKSNIYV